LKIFIVGAGALGCELMKNCALMGFGCSPTGLFSNLFEAIFDSKKNFF